MKTRTILKVLLYVILCVTLFLTIYQSKKYFNTHYHKHQTLESNKKIYKVTLRAEEENLIRHPKVVEQNAEAPHLEPTEVIIDNTLLDNFDVGVLKTTNKVKDKKNNIINKAIVAKKPNVAKKTINNIANTVKKPIKVITLKKKPEIQKPKTLEKKLSVSQSVLNNPLFQSYIVQVGAFKDKKDAIQRQTLVAQNKIASKYITDIHQTHNLYKVFIGYFEESQTARDICTQLKKDNVQCFATKI